MFKPFFVHENVGPGKLPNRTPRGFTAFIAPNSADDRTVKLSIAFCSPKDQFCKRSGRDAAQAAEAVVVNKRELPLKLAEAALRTYHPEMADNFLHYEERRHLYVLKYVV